MPAIQSIQRGTLVTTQNDASPNAVVTITPVITANAVVMFTSKDTDNTDRDHRHLYSAYLSSASQITFTRFTQSFATNVTIEWEVVEFAAGALQSLQTGSVSPTAAVTSVALATPVNPAAAVPLVTEWTNSGTLLYVTPLPSITTTTTAGDTLKFTLPSAPAAGLYNCRWQLIEFKAADASVQSGITVLGSASTYSATQAIAPVDLTKTLVAAFHYGGSTSSDARQSMRYFPASSTSLQFDMQPSGSMAPATIQWYTVTLLDGSKIQSGGLSIAAGATVPTAQPSWSAMAHGSLWSPHQFANAYITGTVDSDPQDVHLAYHFNTTQDGATVSRGGSVTPVSAYYQAVDWASSGGGTGGGTPTTVTATTGTETSAGQPAALVLPTAVNASTGAETSTGQPAALVTPTNIATGTGTEASTGQAAGLVLPTAVNANIGAETSTGQGASIATPTAVNANTGTETNAGQGASVSVGPAIGASTGTETSAGQPAALVLPTNTAANTGAETSTGRAAGLVLPTAINAGTGTEASAGQPAALVTPTNIAAGTGTEASTGQHATVSTPAGALVPTDINASTGAETSTGQHATVSAGTIIPARTGAEDSTGQSAQVSGITPPAPRAIDPDMVYSSERRGYTYPFGGTMDFPDVIAGDVRTLTFNYSSELPAGAEIRSAVPSVRLHAGVDPAPDHIVVGQPIVQGSVVTVQVQPMIAGCSYWPRVKATFSDGQEITYPNPGEGSLRVVA